MRTLAFFVACNSLILINNTAQADQSNCRQVTGVDSTWTSCKWNHPRPQLLAGPDFVGAQVQSKPAVKPALPPVTLPQTFSWQPWMTEVRDQGYCGNCYVFGALAVVESLYKRILNDTLLEIHLSEQDITSCAGAGGCGGGMSQNVASYIQNPGIASAACYPFTSGDTGTDGICQTTCQGRSNIQAWHTSIWPWTAEEIKQKLQADGPLAVNLQVYDDFFTYQTGIYSHKPGDVAGGWHVVALVGWDDTTKPASWIIKNSWETDWGQNGYGWITQRALVDGTGFASNLVYFDVVQGNLPGLPCPESHQVAIQVVQGATANATLKLNNCGERYAINPVITLKQPAAWLSAKAGSIPVDGLEPYSLFYRSGTIKIDVDAAQLTPGSYAGDLVITGGAGTSPLHVDLTVFPAGTDLGQLSDGGITDSAVVNTDQGHPYDARNADGATPNHSGGCHMSGNGNSAGGWPLFAMLGLMFLGAISRRSFKD